MLQTAVLHLQYCNYVLLQLSTYGHIQSEVRILPANEKLVSLCSCSWSSTLAICFICWPSPGQPYEALVKASVLSHPLFWAIWDSDFGIGQAASQPCIWLSASFWLGVKLPLVLWFCGEIMRPPRTAVINRVERGWKGSFQSRRQRPGRIRRYSLTRTGQEGFGGSIQTIKEQ